MTLTRSASLNKKSMSCSIITIVNLRLSVRISSSKRSRPSAPIPCVGSSKNKTRGSAAAAPAQLRAPHPPRIFDPPPLTVRQVERASVDTGRQPHLLDDFDRLVNRDRISGHA